ncbi:unnamed protein product, partial [Cyprideis torosa]
MCGTAMDPKYVIDYECQPKEGFGEKAVKDARLSFLSGHASFSMYTLMFLAQYLHFK